MKMERARVRPRALSASAAMDYSSNCQSALLDFAELSAENGDQENSALAEKLYPKNLRLALCPTSILNGLPSRKITRKRIKVANIDARYSADETVVMETAQIASYESPQFTATATVRFPPIFDSSAWEIGWIQACESLSFTNDYGARGRTGWEIPPLQGSLSDTSPTITAPGGIGRVISDSDARLFPWYSPNAMVKLRGPTTSTTEFSVSMVDFFRPQVTWRVPINEGKNGTDPATAPQVRKSSDAAELEGTSRKQFFIVWLAAYDRSNDRIIPLKTIRWCYDISIKFDPTKRVGQRTLSVEPRVQPEPHLLPVHKIPRNALCGPTANGAQMLIWTSAQDAADRVIVIPQRLKIIS